MKLGTPLECARAFNAAFNAAYRNWKELLLEPELDVEQLLTLLEQFHLNILGKFRNLYVYM